MLVVTEAEKVGGSGIIWISNYCAYCSRTEGQLNQLTPAIASTSVATLASGFPASTQVYSAFHPKLMDRSSTGRPRPGVLPLPGCR